MKIVAPLDEDSTSAGPRPIRSLVNAVAAAFSLAPGLALGSFLNVVAARVPLKRSIVSPPSACMSCSQQIAWYDNVPVASWILLRGRCRHCGAGIPWVYPGVELTTAALVAGCVLAFGVSLDALVAAFFCAVLVVVSATDLAHRIIPNRVVLPAAGVVLVAQTALHPSPRWALAALGASGFLLLAALVYPAGMGMGDVKLALLMGAMLGRLVPVGLMLGMLIALVPSIVLLARHGTAARKMYIPFGPFLALGSVLALFWGEALLDAYLGLF
jgi:leader peptidase (prepilin peptidase) / N-methyltransferase